MKTLIIVDVQNDFMAGGSLEVPNANAIIPIINNLQDKFDLIVATQDWHPANHKSFASNHPGKKPFEKIMLHGLEQTLWPDHCVQGSVGGLDAKQAILQACSIRFRPIMMTTVSAIVAALPIALGVGAGGETRQGLGISIVGGLVFSQLITLYVTPVFYIVMDKLFSKKSSQPGKLPSPNLNPSEVLNPD
ncbi:efflux RND transporter permease subunit [Coxiella burnetii]|uniref:efflux RND transporter permease subunit n=1 Tax=Coxiella burnetii TaxID=777 RepID=UPI0022315E30|nr:efflux RND transporter permease subunit [Coxiella burnetii]